MTAGVGWCAGRGCDGGGVAKRKIKSSREQSMTVAFDSKSTCGESKGTGGGGGPGSTKARTGFATACDDGKSTGEQVVSVATAVEWSPTYHGK